MSINGDVWFIDVGQGHATFARSTSGETLLVDCPAKGSTPVLRLVDRYGARPLNAVVITHRDLDHCAGVPALLRNVGASVVYLNLGYAVPPRGSEGSKIRTVLRDLLSLVEEAQAELKPMVRGDTGQLGQLRWHVLAPPYVDVARASLSDRSNKSSIVLRLEVGPRGFLITGDIEGASAKRMAQLGGLSADVLLIPHHGADGTHLDDLLEATAPTYAIVSAGRTDDHHPTMTTLATVRDSSCVVMCTQANRFCHQGDLVQSFCAGTIRFRVAHGRLFVHPSRRTHERRIRSLDSPVCIDLPRQDISIVANHG